MGFVRGLSASTQPCIDSLGGPEVRVPEPSCYYARHVFNVRRGGRERATGNHKHCLASPEQPTEQGCFIVCQCCSQSLWEVIEEGIGMSKVVGEPQYADRAVLKESWGERRALF